jgi:hypothetical protein
MYEPHTSKALSRYDLPFVCIDGEVKFQPHQKHRRSGSRRGNFWASNPNFGGIFRATTFEFPCSNIKKLICPRKKKNAGFEITSRVADPTSI